MKINNTIVYTALIFISLHVFSNNSHAAINRDKLALTNGAIHYSSSGTKGSTNNDAENRKITIAIIDTGINLNIEPLKKYLDTRSRSFVNPPTKKETNLNDKNMIENPLQDHHGHGTHIAGIILNNILKHSTQYQAQNNKHSTTEKFSLMILKYYDPQIPDSDNIENFSRALKYAIDQHVDVINYSGGGYSPSREEYELIKSAPETTIIAAIGNDHLDTNTRPFFPANYPLKNIISVANIDEQLHLASTSNFGDFDIAAPGTKIKSYGIDTDHSLSTTMTGTSQAAAYVTAIATSLMLQNENLKHDPIALKKTLKAAAQSLAIEKTKRALADNRVPFLLENQRRFARYNFKDFDDTAHPLHKEQ